MQLVPFGYRDENINGMTLQIGIVGSDGVVIASDQIMSQFEGRGFSQLMTSKFISGANSICCYSGDIVAEHAGNNIAETMIDGDKDDIRRALKAAGDKAWEEFGKRGNLPEFGFSRKVIVAFQNGEDRLWLLEIFSQSTANPVYDKVVAGDDKNTARHFTNNYLSYPPPPLANIIRLAAHTVLAGGKENPSGVKGLEVVVWKNGDTKPSFLSRPQITELSESFAGITAELKDRLAETFRYSALGNKE